MRLSDAIALGRTLIKPNPCYTLLCGEGCACGMALAAVGEIRGTRLTLAEHWPWTASNGDLVWYEISKMFFRVSRDEMTLDQTLRHEAAQA
jgi:hypothetical protein